MSCKKIPALFAQRDCLLFLTINPLPAVNHVHIQQFAAAAAKLKNRAGLARHTYTRACFPSPSMSAPVRQ